MECSTKDRILEIALDLFSENGYDGTSMRDLAMALGLSKSALYKHYDSKESIKNALLESIENYYAKHVGVSSDNTVIPDSVEDLKEISLKQIYFTLHDEKIKKSRKVLNIEQYYNSHMASLATKYFGADLERLYAEFFENMMKCGALREDDAEMLAFEYVAPITLLIHQCDRQPELESEILARISAFIDRFIRLHK